MEGNLSLDDLIKKDRQKNKGGKNKLIKKKAVKNSPKALRNKGSQKKINRPLSKGNQNNNKQNNKNRNIRRIQKVRENRINTNKAKPQQTKRDEGKNLQKNVPQPQKKPQEDNKKQDKGKTLRVYGLQSDITNEELYVLFSYKIENFCS